jgi:iron complex transport system ATP-binding protein
MNPSKLDIQELVIGYKKNNQTFFSTCLPNLTFETSQLIAVIGANGCGKSTFLKTILNLIKPISGNISINNVKIKNLSVKELAQWQSVVLTEKLPPSNLTTKDIISLGRSPYTPWHGYLNAFDEEKIEQVITDLDLKSLAAKNHDELSDGQLQRTLIARALVQDTPFIFLDEPTTFLDLSHQFQLFDLLKNMVHKNEKCVVFSTHAIDLAITHCDYILAFTPEGNFYGKPHELIAQNVFDKLFASMKIKYNASINKFIQV